jgi:His-Xaa-Ser system protein HxsD
MLIQKKEVCVDLRIYRQEALTAAVYKFTDRCFVEQMRNDNNFVLVGFQLQPEQEIDLDLLVKQFENELIDQQIRYDTEQKFGSIRDHIVEKAFSSIS